MPAYTLPENLIEERESAHQLAYTQILYIHVGIVVLVPIVIAGYKKKLFFCHVFKLNQ